MSDNLMDNANDPQTVDVSTAPKSKPDQRDLMVVVKMMLPLVAMLLVAGYFHHFVIKSILANVEINGLIIATIVYGTGLILSRFFNAQRDFRLIERFGDEAMAGRPMHELIEEQWIKTRYIRHYFKHVAALENGSSGEANRHAIESELHALNDEYNSKLELPQFLVGFMIALGLLGTFIGLLETLTGISGMLDGIGAAGGGEAMDAQFIKLVGELRKPLAGMGIAFSASMFGLVGSLVLSIMMINLRRYIARVILCARNVMHDITELKQIPLARGHGTAGLAGYSGGVPGAGSGPLSMGNTGLGGGGFGGGFAGGAAPAVSGEGPFDYKEVAPATGTSLQQGYSAEIENTMMMLVGRIDVLSNRLDSLVRSVETSTNNASRMNELLGFGPRMKEMSELTHDQIKTLVEEYAQSRGELGRRFNTLLEKMSVVSESSIASGRHLWEIRESFSKLATGLAAQEMQAASIGQQTLLIEALLNETRLTRQWLAQIFTMNQGQGQQ